MSRRPFVPVLLAASLLAAPAASRAASYASFGPHLGFSSGPGQILGGGHLLWAEIAPRLDLVPGAEIGVGSHETVVGLNGDFHYRFDTNTQWQPYVGGGLALQFASSDRAGPARDDTSTRAGGHIIGGASVTTAGKSQFFAELKLGLGDAPNLKGMAGWHFTRH